MIDERRLFEAVGRKVRALRSSPGENRAALTQAQLAEMVGLERTSITNIERGNQKVPLHVLYRICEALQVPIGELLPSPSEIQSSDPQPVLEDLTFAGRTAKVTPLLLQKLSQFIDTGNRHEEPKS